LRLLEYKETVSRGSPGFPVELYALDACHPQYHMPYHWHTECELIHVAEGRLACALDDWKTELYAGDMLFVNSGVIHAGVPEGCRYRCLVFDPAMLLWEGTAEGALLKRLANRRISVKAAIRAAEHPGLYAAGVRLLDAMPARAEEERLTATGWLYAFFGQVAACDHYLDATDGGKRDESKKMRQLKQVMALIESEYADKLTLPRLAEAAGLTPHYFCHFFQEATQQTPVAYLNAYRIEVARFHLAQGEQSVTEIAYACGFNDLSYFSRIFRKHTGMTPKQYALGMARA
jgi:AraC-like DNA-binding protein/mannose-6-phosphate isomerase-like protein (cupin superfamily)